MEEAGYGASPTPFNTAPLLHEGELELWAIHKLRFYSCYVGAGTSYASSPEHAEIEGRERIDTGVSTENEQLLWHGQDPLIVGQRVVGSWLREIAQA